MSNAKYVYTPHETGLAGYNAAKAARENGSVGINMPHIAGTDIGEYIAPHMPWELVFLVGQQHNGKTMFSDWWENAICAQLRAEGRENEAVVHVSLEESLEALSFYQHSKILRVRPSAIARGDIEPERLEFSMSEIDKIRIFRIADSAMNEDDSEAPVMYLSNIYRILQELVIGNVTGEPVKIAAVFIDYLQALPYDLEVRQANEESKRRLQVRNDVYRLRKMTTHLASTIIVNVQAKQELRGNNPPFYLPGAYDGEETSAIAQRADRIYSVWMPKSSYPIGTAHKDIGTITDELFYLKCLKQRGGYPSGKAWRLKWDYNGYSLLNNPL